MANSFFNILVQTVDSANGVLAKIGHGKPGGGSLGKLTQYLQTIDCGAVQGAVTFVTTAVPATGTFTVAAGNLSANDTVTIGGVAFTAKSSGAAGNQFNIGATALATAQACATAVNASTSTGGLVMAAASGTTTGIVTFTATVPGIIGNQITLAKSATNGSVSGANLASGANDNSTGTIHKGV